MALAWNSSSLTPKSQAFWANSLAHDEPQERPGHGDGGEHRGRDADDQDQGEALDRGRAAEVQDRRR